MIDFERMYLCLRIAAAVWEVVKVEEMRPGDIHQLSQTDIIPVVTTHFKVPIADARAEAVMLALTHTLVLNVKDVECNIWEFAHSLHHILYDEDMSWR